MAKDLFDFFTEAREIFEQANEILGFELTRVCFEGPEEELKQTRITQPAIFVHSYILTKLLQRKGIEPVMAAGHSLGEYSAFCAAESMTFEQALQVVKIRGQLMQKSGEINKGTMAAIIGMETSLLEDICRRASEAGVVQIANYNSPGQLVISGSVVGVEKAIAMAESAGAKRVIPLVVSGAFHSPLMEFAEKGLSGALADVEIKEAKFPVYSNVTAGPVTAPDDIKKMLLQQLTRPVAWVNCMQNMITDGGQTFFEVGPGTVLKGLMRRIHREVVVKTVQDKESLESN